MRRGRLRQRHNHLSSDQQFHHGLSAFSEQAPCKEVVDLKGANLLTSTQELGDSRRDGTELTRRRRGEHADKVFIRTISLRT